MIAEDYVSFETAKLLKEKGFDELCDTKYFGDDCSGPSYIRDSWEDGGDICPMSNSDLDDGSKYTDISAPTLQMVKKWFLKKYNIFISVLFLEEYNGFGYTIENTLKKKYIATSENSSYKEPEEAVEVAIKYCLVNLI